jgi:hypothetical protein
MIDRALGRRARPERQLDPAPDVRIEGELPLASFLVATSHQGLLRIAGGRVDRVAAGCSYYGLAPEGDQWLAFERLGRWGRIVRLDLRDGASSTLVWGLSAGIHQIATTPEALVVTDTYNNRLLVYEDLGAGVRERRQADAVEHPVGRLREGRRSDNYAHFNSLCRHDNVWELVAHNESASTGRTSELFVLDERFDVKDVRPLPHTCCHNFVRHGGTELYCGSGEGVLVADGAEVFRTADFTRGLAVTDDLILLGTSARLARSTRGSGQGSVYALDRNLRVLGVIRVAGTQIHDIQLLPAGSTEP